MATIELAARLETVTCANCGILFAIPEHFEQKRREDHEAFYCPSGHLLVFHAKSEAEKLADQLRAKNDEIARQKARLDQERARTADYQKQVEHKDRQISGYKGVVAKTKRRISKGRCPCCSHEFKNLKQHMQAEHPHWDPDKGAEALAT